MQCEIRLISDKDGNTYVAAVTNDGQVMTVKNSLVDGVELSSDGLFYWRLDCRFGWRSDIPQV